MDVNDSSLPTGSSAYGWPLNVALSASTRTSASGVMRRWRADVSSWLRTSSTADESSRGAIRRSAHTAQVESSSCRIPRKPNTVQSTSGSMTTALPVTASARRSASSGYLAVPYSEVASSIVSMPAVLGVS